MSESLSEILAKAASIKKGSAEDLFDEIPVSLSEFVTSPKYLNNFALSNVQYELVQKMERVLYNGIDVATKQYHKENDTYKLMAEHEKYWKDPVPMVNKIPAMWGKGGGKDSTVRIGLLRVVYILMCLKSPQLYFGMQPQDSIHTLNMAANAPQARDAFFDPIKLMVRKGWFAGKADPIQGAIRFDKSILSISGHSEAESKEGLNLILGIGDEIDTFPTSADSRKTASGKPASNTAEHTWDMMVSSAQSRFYDTYKVVAISYPRFKGSPIMKLMEKGKSKMATDGPKSTWFASGPFPTWEARPGRTKAYYQDAYDDDPIEAAAKYECTPAHSWAPYFQNAEALEACFEDKESPIQVVGYSFRAGSWMPEYKFSDSFYPIQGAIYAIHGDMAVNGDRAGIAMSHVVRWEEDIREMIDFEGVLNTAREPHPFVKNDFCISYDSDKSAIPQREIQIRWARQLCFDLQARGFNIGLMTYDGFQSVDSMQILTAKGIESKRVSTDLNEGIWGSLKDLANDRRLIAVKDVDLLDELKSLTRNQKNKVDHPAGGSKDKADAFACSIAGALVLGGEESPTGERAFFSEPDFMMGLDESAAMPIAFQGVNLNWEY